MLCSLSSLLIILFEKIENKRKKQKSVIKLLFFFHRNNETKLSIAYEDPIFMERAPLQLNSTGEDPFSHIYRGWMGWLRPPTPNLGSIYSSLCHLLFIYFSLS
jgi:hypothetical protein